MSGTESKAPTQTEPTPSKALRKERLVSSRGDPDAERLRIVFSESPAQAHIGFSLNVSFEMGIANGVKFQKHASLRWYCYFFGMARM
jgi:hypothetical protein